MKKLLLIILIILSLTPQAFATSCGLTIDTTFKHTEIAEGVFKTDDAIYLPLVSVCEALGGVVYENSTSDSFYIISRDGDVISHTGGTSLYQLNGNTVALSHPSVKNDVFMVPASMIENCFGVSLVYNENGASISREMYTNSYNELVSRLIKYCLFLL